MFSIDARDYGSGLVTFQMYFVTSPMLAISTTYCFDRAVTVSTRRGNTQREITTRLIVRDTDELMTPSGARIDELVTTSDLFAESADRWKTVCDGVDTVLHAAWYAEPGRYQLSPWNLDCLQGTVSLASGAIAAEVRLVVGVGSCAEYDLRAADLSVDTPLRPSTPYAAAKAAAMSLSHFLPSVGLEFAGCRLLYLYRAGEDARRLVPYLRNHLAAGEIAELTTGDQVRDFLDVAEASRLVADLALTDQQGPINVCSGRPVTIRALAERIADEYGRRDLLRFGARTANAFDPPRVVGVPNMVDVATTRSADW